MGIIEVLLSILAIISGYAFYQKKRADSSDSLLSNTDLKEKLLTNDKQIDQNNNLEVLEEEKRKKIQDDVNKENGNEEDDLNKLKDYFDKPDSN